METSKVKGKLMRTYGVNLLSGINAVLQTAKTCVLASEQAEGITAHKYETTTGYRTHWLEVEYLKAKAEESAKNLRQRIM
jgi:hypothetical protein